MSEPTPTGRRPKERIPEHGTGHPSELSPGGPGRRRRRSRLILVGVVTVAIILLTAVLGFGLSRDPTLLRSSLIGREAPSFALRRLDGNGLIRLSDLRGQVVVINFWASWCAECRVEHSALAAAWQRFRDQGVVLVGIAFNDRTSASLAYANELGGDWPLVEDPESRTALAYGVSGVPETFFLDNEGRIRHRVVGPITYPVLADWISDMLRGS